MQATSHILMIRPANFRYNEETAVNNLFQNDSRIENTHLRALEEFDEFVGVLRTNKVDVIVENDAPDSQTPDALFPNNWISFHHNGTICLYPMFAENRRKERKPEIIPSLAARFKIHKLIDFSYYENESLYLEGTGSMVLDRVDRIAYACVSPRTDVKVLKDFGKTMGYKCIAFNAVDADGQLIYHTNVMMCVAEKFVIINLSSIHDKDERDNIIEVIKNSNKELIKISPEQMMRFAGNMLMIKNTDGERLLVMSSQAYASLDSDQIKRISRYHRILHSKLDTIEAVGGGSARCMMAEIHLPEK